MTPDQVPEISLNEKAFFGGGAGVYALWSWAVISSGLCGPPGTAASCATLRRFNTLPVAVSVRLNPCIVYSQPACLTKAHERRLPNIAEG